MVNSAFIACCVALASPGLAQDAATQSIREFVLVERFGVAHPDQIVELELGGERVDPAARRMLDDAGKEVPFQVLDGGTRIAVRTDLPANATRRWRLVDGRATAETPQAVRVAKTKAGFEIGHGSAAIRLPRDGVPDGGRVPAPIQGMRLRDGSWIGTGPNAIAFAGRPDLKVDGAEVRVVEPGPLVAVAEVTYRLQRPEIRYGETVLAPAGPGRYVVRVRAEAGQPSLMIEEDTDTQFEYRVDLTGLALDQVRYRGHHATEARLGREPDGTIYRQWHVRPALDATVDLPADRNYRARLPIWDPWVFDSGWYWQAYARDGGPDTPLLGLFAGRASLARDVGASGAEVQTHPGSRTAALVVSAGHRSADSRLFRSPRFQWGLFLGTKRDLAPPDRVQPIARQMNLHAGVNLGKVRTASPDFPDPPQGYGSPFLPRKVVDRMIGKARADTGGIQGPGYVGYLAYADPASRDLVEFWADASGARAKSLTAEVRDQARALLDALVNDDGIYSFHFHYWHGGLQMSRQLFWIGQLLASPAVPAEDKARLKAVALLYAQILWDDDFVPMDNSDGINLGTPNMPVQQSGFRDQFALFLSGHPAMKERVAQVEGRVLDTLRHDINEHGSPMSSVHYIGAGMGPTLTLMQQLGQAGRKDFFRDEPRVAKFADFLMNCVTPPEPRFGGRRSLISVGDGSTEATELLGQLGTGLAESDPGRSRRLMRSWRDQGRRHSFFHGTTLLKIDEELPDEPAPLASANFPGYFSVLRTGWGTPNETAAWFINGNHYWDHSHADQGEVVLYALGAPLSLDWGSTYEPRVDGAFAHSVALPEKILGHAWDKPDPPMNAGLQAWGTYAGTKTTREAFRADPRGGWARARMRSPDGSFIWTRAVSLGMFAEDMPVIALQDTFEGAEGPKVFTLNLAAEGDVETPGGRVTPPPRMWGNDSVAAARKLPKELPSAGSVFALPTGLSRLRFTGQAWKAHPSGGIDFDVYVFADREQQAQIGNWAHAWHPQGETELFEQANGRPFEERQHILRIHGDGPFRVLLIPRPKGRQGPEPEVKAENDTLVVRSGRSAIRLAPDGTWPAD